MSNWEYHETELWRYGENDISIYHVFSTIAVGMTVLVFAEARHGTGTDAACAHDIVLKISHDGGRHFASNICLLPADGEHCYCNPVPVYDSKIGRLYLFYADNRDNLLPRNFYISSNDLGMTWSPPQTIDSLFELPFNLPGPGHGICLQHGARAGRLIVPFWHRGGGLALPLTERGYCASFLYSDDHGESWHRGAYIGHEVMANECRLSETAEEIVWSMRTKDTVPVLAYSRDGGQTWSLPEKAALPPARNCDIGAIGLQIAGRAGYENLLLLSRVSHPDQRRDMEIVISPDGGHTFPLHFPLMCGDAMPGYSDLCVIEGEEKAIGLVHCRCNHVLFSYISLQTLTGGKYDGTERTVWL